MREKYVDDDEVVVEISTMKKRKIKYERHK